MATYCIDDIIEKEGLQGLNQLFKTREQGTVTLEGFNSLYKKFIDRYMNTRLDEIKTILGFNSLTESDHELFKGEDVKARFIRKDNYFVSLRNNLRNLNYKLGASNISMTAFDHIIDIYAVENYLWFLETKGLAKRDVRDDVDISGSIAELVQTFFNQKSFNKRSNLNKLQIINNAINKFTESYLNDLVDSYSFSDPRLDFGVRDFCKSSVDNKKESFLSRYIQAKTPAWPFIKSTSKFLGVGLTWLAMVGYIGLNFNSAVADSGAFYSNWGYVAAITCLTVHATRYFGKKITNICDKGDREIIQHYEPLIRMIESRNSLPYLAVEGIETYSPVEEPIRKVEPVEILPVVEQVKSEPVEPITSAREERVHYVPEEEPVVKTSPSAREQCTPDEEPELTQPQDPLTMYIINRYSGHVASYTAKMAEAYDQFAGDETKRNAFDDVMSGFFLGTNYSNTAPQNIVSVLETIDISKRLILQIPNEALDHIVGTLKKAVQTYEQNGKTEIKTIARAWL